ncbi:hypothetical protein ABH920_005689 [Catenulispora sp. EB89]|uniref:hypothetical protein n=1 Tax=Catenulispora sp. EB89 TaxID=3156257 RepID=UPI003513E102
MYSSVRLTKQQVNEGMISRIGDAIRGAFIQSAKAILEQGLRGEKQAMRVLFEASPADSEFWNQYDDDISDILYLNDAAKSAVEAAGIGLAVAEVIDAEPKNFGVLTQMPRYVNLR